MMVPLQADEQVPENALSHSRTILYVPPIKEERTGLETAVPLMQSISERFRRQIKLSAGLKLNNGM